MRVVVGSISERKVSVCRDVFARYLGKDIVVEMYDVPSGVSPTPHDRETLDGARNRARECSQALRADCYVGLESGLVDRYGQVFEEAWCCILTGQGVECLGYSSGLRVPDLVLNRMRISGQPHYEVMIALEAEQQLPHDTWSNYSGGILTRQAGLEEAVRNAVVQLVRRDRSFYRCSSK